MDWIQECDKDEDPEDFPEIWLASEGDKVINIDAIINKHVVLALRTFLTNEEYFYATDSNDDEGEIYLRFYYDGVNEFSLDIVKLADLLSSGIRCTAPEYLPRFVEILDAAKAGAVDAIEKHKKEQEEWRKKMDSLHPQ